MERQAQLSEALRSGMGKAVTGRYGLRGGRRRMDALQLADILDEACKKVGNPRSIAMAAVCAGIPVEDLVELLDTKPFDAVTKLVFNHCSECNHLARIMFSLGVIAAERKHRTRLN